MSDTDINKWISGETDRFFHPGKPPKGSSFWKVGHPLIAIVGAIACALTVIGFVSSRLFSAQTSISAPSAKAPLLMGILALVPSPVKPEGFTPSSINRRSNCFYCLLLSSATMCGDPSEKRMAYA